MDKDNNISVASDFTRILTGLSFAWISVGVGASHGFMDAQGTPISSECLEQALMFGPTIVQGEFGAGYGGISGFFERSGIKKD